MEDVEGKVAFITGGASGMGLGMATVFARNGMKVVIADIRQEALDEAMAGFKGTNLAVHPVRLDVTDRAAWAQAADEAEKVFGKVHVLVNNAGVGVVGPMQKATYADWDFVMGVCLGGVINGVQTFVPRLLAHGEGGHIVNNASQSGVFASGQAGLYITAKFGVAGLSEALASDLQDEGVGVSCYFPGPVATNLGATTQQVRPETLSDSGYKGPRVPPPQLNGQPRPAFDPELLRRVFMDPIEVGERVLRGIRRGDLFIFSHPEFREGMQARCDAVMRAIPDEPVNEERRQVLETFGTLLYNPIYERQTTPRGKPTPEGRDPG
jgi:NAD(P)-dependent dehydrogenase (short-subunit alcohol dehydrogenase family)